MAPSLFPFSLLSSDSRFGEPFYNGSRIFPLDKNSLYIYMYITKKKKEEIEKRNVIIVVLELDDGHTEV